MFRKKAMNVKERQLEKKNDNVVKGNLGVGHYGNEKTSVENKEHTLETNTAIFCVT